MFTKPLSRFTVLIVLAFAMLGTPAFAQMSADDLLKSALANMPQSAEYNVSMKISRETENGSESIDLSGYGAFLTSPDVGSYMRLGQDSDFFEILRTPLATTVSFKGKTSTTDLIEDPAYLVGFKDPLYYEAMTGIFSEVVASTDGNTPTYYLTTSNKDDVGNVTSIELWLSQDKQYPVRLHTVYIASTSQMDITYEFTNWDSLQALPALITASAADTSRAKLNTSYRADRVALQSCASRGNRVRDNRFLGLVVISRTYLLNVCEANDAANHIDGDETPTALQSLICDPVSDRSVHNECLTMSAAMFGFDKWLKQSVLSDLSWLYYANALRWAAASSCGVGADINHIFWLSPYPNITRPC